MSFVDPGQQQAGAPLPAADELFPEEKPDAAELFPEQAPDRSNEPQRRAAGILGPLKAAVAPGPVGDWIFGNTQHSSLARIMHAFGSTVSADVAQNLPMSDETRDYLKEKGVFNDYAAGQASLLKANAETLARSGAVVVNGAIYGIPAVFHGLQEATMEAGEQAQETAVGKAIGVKGLARSVAALPEAFPTFEHPNLPRPPGRTFGAEVPNVRVDAPHPPLPEPLAAARELDVIGPGGEAAWKGVGDQESPGPVPIEPVIEPPATEPRPEFEAQRAKIAADVEKQLVAAGRPAEEAEAAAQIAAARYVARAERMNGAIGTPEELYRREGADIRGEQIRQKVTSPGAARALDDFQERMAQGKEMAQKRRNEGQTSAGKVVSTEEKFAGTSEEEFKAQQAALEDSIEALEPEERAEARQELSLMTPDDWAYLDEKAKSGEFFQTDAYHGSPHLFDKFDTSKIGTGEGAQAYGHGLYFAESEDVAQMYQKNLAPSRGKLPDYVISLPHEMRHAMMMQALSDADALTAAKRAQYMASGLRNSDVNMLADMIGQIRQAKRGALYKVSLKPDKEDLLDWDKPLSEQSPQVQAILKKAGVKGDPTGQEVYQSIIKNRPGQGGGTTSAGMRLRDLDATPEAASKSFFHAGIPGIKYADAGSRSAEGGTHNFVIFDHSDVEITHRNGEALTKEERADAVREMEQGGEHNQGALGKIRFAEGRKPLITLMKRANASTFIHESGHQWLEELMRDAVHEAAPADLKADAKTVRDWLGAKEGAPLKTRHHEKFARAFEQYIREGVAPSRELANVFAKFKAWLTRIYQTAQKLGSPITDDIRGVFDRMLENTPQRTEIAPEREGEAPFHERHEAMADAATPERAHEIGNHVEAEMDSVAAETLVKEDHASYRDSAERPGEGAPEGAEPTGVADAGPDPGKPGAPAEAGAERAGAGAPAQEGAGSKVKTEPPATAAADFPPGDSRLTDKIGNFRIDGLNVPEQILAAMRENVEKRGGLVELHRRGIPATDGDLLTLGISSGLNPAWLDSKKIGDAYSHREIKALEEMFIAASTAVKDAAAAAESGDPKGILAHAEAMARQEMIQAHLSGASAEAGRSLGAVRRVVKKVWGDGRPTRTAQEAAESLARVKELSAQQWESPEALSAALKKETGRTLFQIQEMARFMKNIPTPGGIARFVHDTADGKARQAIVFYYVNALLSGPITHLKYALGNQVTAMYSPVRTSVAAGVDFASYHAGLQAERRVFLGEAGTEIYAMGRGFTEGIQAGKEGWRLGTTPDLPGESAASLFGAQPIINPIPGKVGYVLGIPGKGVGLVHGFGAAMRYRQEINRLAYRTAMQEKLQGDAFTSRVAELTDRPTPENMEAAAKASRSDLYMAPVPYNSFTSNLQRVGDSNILAKIILPFVKIGIQVERKALINSPFAPFLKEARENLSGANGIEARNTQVASMVAGTGLMVATATMAANGDLTGHGPHDKAKRDVWLALHQPYTVAIGPVTLNYAKWGYLGKLMAIAANAYETHQGWGDEEGHSIASAYYQGFQEALFDDSFLRGVKDFIDAKEDPDRYGARFASNMLLNWEPMSVGQGQIARMVDPYQRETHTSSDTFLDTLFKEAWNKTPFASYGLYPRRDVFGEPIPAGATVGGAISGLELPNYTNDPTVKLLDSLHIGISPLRDSIRGVKLTDHQYDDYARVAGRTVKMSLDRMMQTTGRHLAATGRPEDRAKLVELVHSAVNLARKQAQNTIMMHAYGSENDIVKQATEAKKVKKGLVAPTAH